jgi:hypothetical protein
MFMPGTGLKQMVWSLITSAVKSDGPSLYGDLSCRTMVTCQGCLVMSINVWTVCVRRFQMSCAC